MKTWQKPSISERREVAKQKMPLLKKSDCQKVTLRRAYTERAEDLAANKHHRSRCSRIAP